MWMHPCLSLQGFVEELAVADDPEYESWSVGQDPSVLDSAATGRTGSGTAVRTSTAASVAGVGGGGATTSSGHERRQTLLFLLDARVRRRMARTVLEMGGNAVLGYHQNFDMEGDSGIVRLRTKND
jgi:hypothetical protein